MSSTDTFMPSMRTRFLARIPGIFVMTGAVIALACLPSFGQGVPADTASVEGMVRIPGGSFDMGERGAVEPVTHVTLPPYYMDRTEVSVARYAVCVRAGLCSETDVTTCGEQSNWARPGRENHPMNCVDWAQARALCASRGARLPTEAEWEFAARGSDGRPYPWGFEAADATRASFHSEAQGQLSVEGYRVRPRSLSDRASEDRGTSAVDSHPAGASPFGLLNMAGNVWEWVEDRYAPYPGGRVSRPHGPPAGTGNEARVVRGGGYSSMNAAGFRTFDRDRTLPGQRGRNLGFRCARDAGG